MRPGPSARELRTQSLVVLEGELELHQRGINRPDRFHAMATEVVRGTLDPLPVRTVTGFPPPACTSSTRGRPAPPASRRYAPGRASDRRSDRRATARRRYGDRRATRRRQPIRPVAKTVSYITPRRPRRAAVIPDSQGVCPAGSVRDKSARAIRIEGPPVGTTSARPVAKSAALPRSDTNIQRDRDHHALAWQAIYVRGDMSVRSINPATGEVLETFQETAADELARILEGADAASREWCRTPAAERAERLRAAARVLRERKDTYARTMALEMGKPLAQGVAEAEKCAWVCDYYADHGPAFLADEPHPTDASRSYVRFEALGPVFAIMPWNFPFWQVFRFAAPALVAGNAGILKHAPNVPRCAIEIETVFQDPGFPDGLFRAVFLSNEAAGGVIADQRLRAVTLTGSDRAGSQVAEQAGRHLKKTVLELGGSDPFIVLEDADLERAATTAVEARLINSGQSCIAAKRFIVVERVAERFLERFTSDMRARRVGDPLDPATQVGPQARVDLRENLHRQVQESVKRGARLVLGGEVPAGRGAFYPPTVLSAVEPGMPAFDQETFGPVAAVIRAKDEADAIRMANASPYGLGASVWTADSKRGERVAREIEAGSVVVNGLVRSDPRLPFGRVKRSGYGRELSAYGLREFVNIKTVWVA